MAAKEEQKADGSEMKPWEQHSAVISIPRFDYNAPTSLLHHSCTGFLVTCPIKREKSATKEAMSIFQKFIVSSQSCNTEDLESSDKSNAAKRRKVLIAENDEVSVKCVESKSADVGEKLSEGSCAPSVEEETDVGVTDVLSLVKLIRSGLLLFIFHKDHSNDVANTVSTIMQSLESGSLKSPLWCHRIFPIQATCTLNVKELTAAVSKLVLQFVNDEKNKLVRPVKFAVGYNRRGFEEAEIKGAKKELNNSDAIELLDRNKCFTVVAAAVKEAISDSVVDLGSPQLSVLVELLPISRVTSGSLVAGVSVLPYNLVSTKPKLGIKALVSDIKTGNGKKNSKNPVVPK
ncbi:THUMP domain-containing protein [Heracleum sosnowskyi]|uniref:THUMP domain-containing protein n=1 Tax=Heracleum sosnowskyi TaxID=360622 RepID=A0AAD8MW26_9APIA|nr:THUMP domain-containing protein [Heracleum sosnowskyi]